MARCGTPTKESQTSRMWPVKYVIFIKRTYVTNPHAQILRVEHQDLVLSFLEFQVGQFDKFYRKQGKYAVDAETSSKSHLGEAGGSGNQVTTPRANLVTILGSKQKSATIETFIKGNEDPAFTSFCRRVSIAIQALSLNPSDTIAISDFHQV